MEDIAGSITGHRAEKIPIGQRIELWTSCKDEREEHWLRQALFLNGQDDTIFNSIILSTVGPVAQSTTVLVELIRQENPSFVDRASTPTQL
jgi:hypothetical protein